MPAFATTIPMIAAAHQQAAPAAPVVYVSDAQDGFVDAFSQRNPSEMVLQIQHLDEPGPMWVDAQKQLFVVQKDGWIAGYRRGQTNFFVRYVDPELGGDNPAGLCGDRMGHLYFTTNQLGGFISYVYQYDVGNPYYVADYSWGSDQGASVGGCTVDAAGDLIVSVRQGMPQTQLVEFPYPVFSSSPLTLQPALGTNPIMDKQNDLLVPTYTPSGSAMVIDVYSPPYTGTPIATVPNLPIADSFALDASGPHLWTDALLSYPTSQVTEFAYPSGKPEYAASSLSFWPSGFAVSPAVQP
jgi:hypothetical protein